MLQNVRTIDEPVGDVETTAIDELKSSVREIVPTLTAEEILMELGLLA